MPRQARPPELSLGTGDNQAKDAVRPTSSPIHLEGVDLSSFAGGFGSDHDFSLNSLPPLPLSPQLGSTPSQNRRDASPSMFSSIKEKTVPDKDGSKENIRTDAKANGKGKANKDDYRAGAGSMSKVYHLRNTPGSTPELSIVGSGESVRKTSLEAGSSTIDGRPQPVAQQSDESVGLAKRNQRSFRNPLARNKSIRRDSDSKAKPNFDFAPKTAPLQAEFNASETKMFGKSNKEKSRRGKSSERMANNETTESQSIAPSGKDRDREKEKDRDRDKEPRSGLIASGQNVMSKAKTGSGNLFKSLVRMGKGSHGHGSGSSDSRIPDSEYVLKVLRLPLVEQTRLTRLTKQLADCRDKTEYWMPSLPWRCIDYLNQRSDDTGLYRVPGSLISIRHWTRRFDEEMDIDFYHEDVSDPNDIASLLKDWFRGLPTEIIPKTRQNELAEQIEKENPNYRDIGEATPQCLRDAISELPPFNYYLLFAITCHLSLLLAHKEKNKMDLNNLAICVMPCLGLDRWLFNYLVGDWRHCWQGCYTEKKTLGMELMVAAGQAPEEAIAPPATTTNNNNNDGDSVYSTSRPPRSGSNSSPASRAASRSRSRTTGNNEDDLPTKQNIPLPRRDDSQTRQPEMLKPATYIPTGMTTKPLNAESINLLVGNDIKRPSSADDNTFRTASEGRGSDEDVSVSKAGSTLAPIVPKNSGHNRSQSDLPLTPASPPLAHGGFNFGLSAGKA